LFGLPALIFYNTTMDWQSLTNEYKWMLRPLLLSGIIIVITGVILMVLSRAFELIKPKIPVPAMAFLMIRRVARYAVLIIALSVILNVWGLQLNSLLAMIGGVLAMVAIGFVAVWSLLSNILCAFVLAAFRPFQIGDEVEVLPENVKGRVIDLTLLYTSLKTDDGDYFRIPNNLFFQRIFRCREGTRRIDLGEQLLQTAPAE